MLPGVENAGVFKVSVTVEDNNPNKLSKTYSFYLNVNATTPVAVNETVESPLIVRDKDLTSPLLKANIRIIYLTG